MTGLRIDQDRIEEVSARLNLRKPNREALETLVYRMSSWFDLDGRPPPFEGVIDSATGVGKTYILVAAIEYLAAQGVRNFAVVTPGRTVLNKTVDNFTPGHSKSLTGSMESDPVVITAENFDTPAVRGIIDNDSRNKVYIFTVQALIKPTTKTGRRTHEFQEGLGAGFYEYLQRLDDLIVFADEHHLYYGLAFSDAVRGLDPRVIVGLTATPHAKTEDSQIIYRYPLAAAIAERYVKTPVIVGRRDDRSDDETKLADGLLLLSYKQKVLDSYCTERDLPLVKPVMLVLAQNTTEADEFERILSSSEFDGGRWTDVSHKGSVLKIHSNLKGDAMEDALARLDAVEDPDSPVRIILSVGMLKEGWDVKNVYVIASMRASVSKVLTEQTLGRGLRLPFGAYTDVEILDTLEVVAHEQYEALLQKAGVWKEAFIDRRTWAVLRQNAAGETVVATETAEVVTPLDVAGTVATELEGIVASGVTPGTSKISAAAVKSVESRSTALAAQVGDLGDIDGHFIPNPDFGVIKVPKVDTVKVEAQFSTSDVITDGPNRFERLGRRLRADPELRLQRVKVSAKVITGPDGLRRTELVTTTATDQIEASGRLFPLAALRDDLLTAVLSSSAIPNRPSEIPGANRIIDAFVEGLGPEAEKLLSFYGDRAASLLVKELLDEQRRHASVPHFEKNVEMVPVTKERSTQRQVSQDRTGSFSRSAAYNSWQRSLYSVDWFDSRPERSVAAIADDSDQVLCWVRLQIGDVQIRWKEDGRDYNPDVVVIENSGDSWVVEAKMDKEMTSAEVLAKRDAAKRWVNTVNDSGAAEGTWHYLLVSETDIDNAKHSWAALKKLGV